MAGFLDNPKIGLNDFHEAWDGKQAEYTFGACLSENEQGKLKSGRNLTSQISSLSLPNFDDNDISEDDSEYED